MIALLACSAIIGVFIAGHLFAVSPVAACVLVAAGTVCLGILFAAAETRGFEGQQAENYKGQPYNWDRLFLDVTRIQLKRQSSVERFPVYVQMPTGTKPITGVFTARLNSELCLVLDTATEDAAHTFNTLKQGVM